MSEPEPETPAASQLGPAADHHAAAERAAGRGDFGAAVRERYRALVRGLEQGGVLPVRRSRTAHRSAESAAQELPDDAAELAGVAEVFDEVVYGGREADAQQYARLARLDRFSALAPAPAPEPVEVVSRPRRTWRRPSTPELLRNPRFWAALAGLLVLILLLWTLPRACGVSTPAPPPPPPVEHDSGDNPPPRLPDTPSIFERWPAPVAFGGVQLLIAGAAAAMWRGRRRGALVAEPRPVEAPANETVAGRAGLYRRSGDRAHVAGLLRTAAGRRVAPALGVAADAPALVVVAAVARRLAVPADQVAAVLTAPVATDADLSGVAVGLDWIEAGVGGRGTAHPISPGDNESGGP